MLFPSRSYNLSSGEGRCLQRLLLVALGDVDDLESCWKEPKVSVGAYQIPDRRDLMISSLIRVYSNWSLVQTDDHPSISRKSRRVIRVNERTRRQALLQLVGLVGVLQDEGVDEALAADLELDLLVVAVALDAGSCTLRRRTVSLLGWGHSRVGASSQTSSPELQPGSPSPRSRPAVTGKTYRRHPCGGRSQ